MKQNVFYILIVIFTSCSNGDSRHISPIAKNYIDEVITLLQNNSINKNKINWEDFRNDVYRHAKGSKTIDQTYPSITYAIRQIRRPSQLFCCKYSFTRYKRFKTSTYFAR
jgi:hypothetical protein